MQSGVIEKLYFSIGLIDKVSGPSKGIAKSLQKIQKTARAGFMNLTKGAGVVGALAYGLLKITTAARDFNKAIRESASLGVAAGELDALGAASKRFVMKYGGDAAAIVRSAYDIQSAIPGMVKGALATFTYQSALLAKAGKSIPAVATKYMGTMYNIFKDTANKIGQSKWVEKLTGQTAHAVKIFKTTTAGMNEAFKGVGSMGTLMGIKMSEQIAVLGTLQGSLSSAEAGTAYKSMLAKYSQAQKVLNMSFKDSSGALLPTYEIIDKINKKIGHLDKDDKIAALTKAFGEVGAKAVMNMLDKTGQLKKDIEAIGKISDASGAEKMAAAMTDPLERLAGIGNVLKITFSQIILPGINMVLGGLSGLGIALVWLLDVFPPLRWALGLVVAAATALVVAWGIMKISMGVMGIWNALALKISLVKVSLWKLNVISGTMTKTQKIAAIWNYYYTKSLSRISATAKFLRLNLLWNKTVMIASAVWTKVLAVAQWIMAAGFWGCTAAVWGFTTALLLCPVTWIVIGIMALVGAVVALIYYWDEVCDWVLKYSDYLLMLLGPIGWVVAAFRNWDKITAWLGDVWNAFKKVCPNIANLLEKLFNVWWSGITGMFAFWKGVWNGIINFFVSVWNGIVGVLAAGFGWIANIGGGAWDGILNGIKSVYNWLSDMLVPVIQLIGSLFDWLGGLGTIVWSAIKGIFSGIDGFIGSILRTIAKIPGLGFLDPSVSVSQTTKLERPVVPTVKAQRSNDIPAGGIRNNNRNKTNNYGGVTINTSRAVGPGEMEDMWALQG